MRRASLLGAILLLLVATVALAAGAEELRLATLSNGGGRSVTGDSVLVGSIGQPLVGKLSDSSSQLCAGYPDCRFPELSIADDSILEGNTASATASFLVTLSYATAQTVTAQYATVDDTATAGSDYLAASGTLTFTPGITEVAVPVTVYGDTVHEGDEIFTVSLSAPVNATLGKAEATGTILDDDPATSISVADSETQEGDAGTTEATFVVTLSSATAQTVTVQYATVDDTATAGSDYLAASGTLTFTPGLTETTIVVDVLGDTEPENDETFLLNLNDPQFATLTDSQAVGLILDDEGEYRVFLPLVVR